MARRQYRRRYDANKAFEFIVSYKLSNDGNSPSLKEIGQAMGINSSSTVRVLVSDLVDAGKVKWGGNMGEARQIMVIGGKWVYTPQFIEYLQTLDMGNGYAELVVGALVSYEASDKVNDGQPA